MPGDYAISLNGISNATQRLDTAAQRIAKANPYAATVAGNSAPYLNPAADLVEVKQAEIAAKANMKVITVLEKIDEDTVDIGKIDKRS
jgi:hypothetical protein